MKLKATVDKIFEDEDNKLKAIASVSIGGSFAIHGVKVIGSDKGLFVAMPSNSYRTASGENKYQNIFHPITAEARQEFTDSVVSAYEKKLEETESEDETEKQTDVPVQSM